MLELEFKNKWLSALKSGDFVRAEGDLCNPNIPNCYCVLGLGLAVNGYKFADENMVYLNGTTVSGYDVLRDKGLTDDDLKTIYRMSDNGKPLSEIADFIEQEVR